MSTNISLFVVTMSTNMALSGYQNVNEHLPMLLSKCPRTWHYPVTNMSTNSPLSGYSNVNEYTRKLINTKINKATIFTLTVRTQNSGGETTSSRRIQLIAKMNLIDVFSNQRLYMHSIGTCAAEISY